METCGKGVAKLSASLRQPFVEGLKNNTCKPHVYNMLRAVSVFNKSWRKLALSALSFATPFPQVSMLRFCRRESEESTILLVLPCYLKAENWPHLGGLFCLRNAATTMIEEAISENELAFLAELEKHENQWIAFVESNGKEIIVGSGKDAVEAMGEAEGKGFPDAILLRVPPFDRGYIPTTVRG